MLHSGSMSCSFGNGGVWSVTRRSRRRRAALCPCSQKTLLTVLTEQSWTWLQRWLRNHVHSVVLQEPMEYWVGWGGNRGVNCPVARTMLLGWWSRKSRVYSVKPTHDRKHKCTYQPPFLLVLKLVLNHLIISRLSGEEGGNLFFLLYTKLVQYPTL